MKEISSRHNPLVKEICDLHDAKGRKAARKFIAEGQRVIASLLDAGMPLDQLLVSAHMVEKGHALVASDRITLVDDIVMKKMSASVTPSGILGIFHMPPALSPQDMGPGLVLAQVADPGNMGTMIRTCAALNIPNVVIVEGTDPYSPKAVQASAGALALVRIFIMSWQELIEHKKNLSLYALVVSGGSSLVDINPVKSLLVVGSEAHGIPDVWLADCEHKVTIAMPGHVESLNAAIAAGIALYQVWCK